MLIKLSIYLFPLSFVISFALIFIIKNKFSNAYDFLVTNTLNGKLARAFSLILLSFIFAEGLASLWNYQSIEYDAEIGTLIISWLYAHGFPMYQNLNGPKVYSLLYGPLMYLPASLIFYLGGGLFLCKFIGISGVIAYIVSLWKLCEKNKYKNEIFLWGLICFIFFMQPVMFTSRMDSWLLSLPMLGALFAKQGRFLLITIAASFAVCIKITALLYFIPIFAFHFYEKPIKANNIVISIGVFFTLLICPFIFLNNVSFDGFIYWLHQASIHGKVYSKFIGINLYALIIIIPLIVGSGYSRKNNVLSRKFIIISLVFLFCELLTSYAATKIGAGSYHIAPYIATIIVLLSKFSNDWEYSIENMLHQSFFAVVLVVFFVVNFQYVSAIVFTNNKTFAVKVSAEMIDEMKLFIKDSHDVASSFSIGSGHLNNKQNTALINLLQLGGQYVINDVVMWDWKESNIAIPESTLDLFRNCAVKHWLIPSKDKPFHTQSVYKNKLMQYPYMFTPIEDIFEQVYYKEKEGVYFDLWSCKHVW